MKYQDINAKTINNWIIEGWQWGIPISIETYKKAQNGQWDVLLTPTKPVPHEWFGCLDGKKVLGLASGGAQQMPIFAALKADCTVLDYSDLQLKSEKDFSCKAGYKINIVKADMTEPLPFKNEEFDLIFHPVSNCYVEEVEPIFKECYRVLKKGGIFLSGLDNGVNFIVNEDETKIINRLPFNPLKDKDQLAFLQKDDYGIQFSHTLTEQIGGQLKAGFTIVDLYEDTNGEGYLHELNIPCFLATKSIKF